MIQEIQANQKTNHQLTTLISTGIYIPAINAKVTLTTNNATDTAFLKIFTLNAKPSLYNPLKDSEQLVLKAVNTHDRAFTSKTSAMLSTQTKNDDSHESSFLFHLLTH